LHSGLISYNTETIESGRNESMEMMA